MRLEWNANNMVIRWDFLLASKYILTVSLFSITVWHYHIQCDPLVYHQVFCTIITLSNWVSNLHRGDVSLQSKCEAADNAWEWGWLRHGMCLGWGWCYSAQLRCSIGKRFFAIMLTCWLSRRWVLNFNLITQRQYMGR